MTAVIISERSQPTSLVTSSGTSSVLSSVPPASRTLYIVKPRCTPLTTDISSTTPTPTHTNITIIRHKFTNQLRTVKNLPVHSTELSAGIFVLYLQPNIGFQHRAHQSNHHIKKSKIDDDWSKLGKFFGSKDSLFCSLLQSLQRRLLNSTIYLGEWSVVITLQ